MVYGYLKFSNFPLSRTSRAPYPPSPTRSTNGYFFPSMALRYRRRKLAGGEFSKFGTRSRAAQCVPSPYPERSSHPPDVLTLGRNFSRFRRTHNSRPSRRRRRRRVLLKPSRSRAHAGQGALQNAYIMYKETLVRATTPRKRSCSGNADAASGAGNTTISRVRLPNVRSENWRQCVLCLPRG